VNKRIAEVYIIFLIAVMMTSSGFIGYYLDNKTTYTEAVTRSSIIPDLTGLAPGESMQTLVPLACPAEGNYAVTMVFSKGETDTLSQYINVSLTCGEISFSKTLTELFGDNTIQFDYYLTTTETVQANLNFAIPSSVGNEAQGATADVKIEVTIEKI
jgi:hypothetical protein